MCKRKFLFWWISDHSWVYGGFGLDYDYWVCSKCGEEKVNGYDVWIHR